MKKITLLLLAFVLYIKADAQTQQQIDNQIAFTKLYGYVRYFNPSDEAAGIDWDKFAIYGSKKVAACNNNQQLKTALEDLFLPIAPTLQIGDKNLSLNKAQLIPSSLSGYKTIAWQHLGVGLVNDKRSPYQSARTNRNLVFEQIPLQAGALIVSGLDARPYRGKEFKLQARAKMVSGTGTGHLWARADLDNRKSGFFNNMMEDPIIKNEWQDYTIKGVVDTNAVSLVTGTFLSGTGEFLFDNFKVSVKEGGEWKEIFKDEVNSKKNGPFNINAYANAEYSYNIIEDETAPKQKWTSITSIPKEIAEKHSTYFKAYPAVGEFINKNIGSGLNAIIPLALYGTTLHTYPLADTAKLSALKSNYSKIPDAMITGDDLNTRLADLCITWNVLQHFFPYFDFAQTNWAADLRDAITTAYADKTSYDFKKNLQRLTARLKDGHIFIRQTRGDKDLFIPPIAWEWIEGKLVITHVIDNAIALKKGDIVTAINGIKPEDHFKTVTQYISAATTGYLNHRAQTESLLGERDSELKLTVSNTAGATSDVLLKRSMPSQQFDSPAYGDIKMLTNDIMYINIGSAYMKVIDSALPQLQNARTIICDLRGYPKDNNNFIEYLLTKKDTAANWMQIPHIIYPDQEKIAGYTKEGFELRPRKPHLNAKIIFLTDGQAISWAESYMSFIEHYKLATIIGQPTAGTNGNINNLFLPGGYHIVFTGMKVVKLDGSPHHGVGTKPDIYVNKTIKGIREGRDEFLEKAIEVAQGFNK
ncbi:S41 family peptidase [Mucilaginibacter sp. HD30]